jgi:hypothetical protein
VSEHIPYFIKGECYYNLDSDEDFEGLLRGIKTQFRMRHPREGVFISYAHADNDSRNPEERWLDRFVEFLKPLIRHRAIQQFLAWVERAGYQDL